MLRDLVLDARSCRTFREAAPGEPPVIGKNDLLDLVDTARLCPSAANRQPLKYRLVYEKEEVEDLLPLTHWAAALPDMHFPPDGHHPAAFIVLCCDTSITENPDDARFDAGIAVQTLFLQACESGMGGCIIGSFDAAEVSGKLLIPKKYKPMLLVALGIPDETTFLCQIPASGSTAYFRDKANLHFVPKRALEDLIIE